MALRLPAKGSLVIAELVSVHGNLSIDNANRHPVIPWAARDKFPVPAGGTRRRCSMSFSKLEKAIPGRFDFD